ncbi:hypothetical protein [Lysobacter capsici]|uniref:hypothetical protein n=1 Tax=Lysobacter capsici TaxID=435897 RepID=UPI00287B653E|nr:hypothetical protein [Lysobacter capsici]WND81831.1 hypothetical protein RJ610_05540 [Lysobacter capsici]WND87028.1 hypothetical protein RJ609_05545 [Lysobacter capsici]
MRRPSGVLLLTRVTSLAALDGRLDFRLGQQQQQEQEQEQQQHRAKTKPNARSDYENLSLRGGAAIARRTITPPAAALVTLELRPGKDIGCAGHLVN